MARQMLVDMLWRVKTDRADEVLLGALADPDVVLHAIGALQCRFGNEAARSHVVGLVDHPDPRIRCAARKHLQRIDKGTARGSGGARDR